VKRLKRLAPLPRIVIALLILSVIGTPTLTAPRDAALRGDYAAALRYHPDDIALLERWAATLRARGQSDAAEMVQRRVIALRGTPSPSITAQTPQTLRTALNQALISRDWRTAQAHAAQLVTLTPQDSDTLYTLAILTAPDDPERAIALFGQIAVDPRFGEDARLGGLALSRAADRASGLRALATQLIARERWALAEYLLNRLSGLEGLSAGTLALLALAQESQGRDGSGLLTIALSIQPDDPTVNYAAAIHWRRAGDADRALAALGKATAADPNNAAIPAEIAAIYRQQARPDEAASFYELAARLAPGEVGFQRALTAFYADESFQLDGAGDEAIRRALGLFPNDAELGAIYGQIRFRQGQIEVASAALKRALELDPGNLRARYYQGQMAQENGDNVAARAAYNDVISRAPDSAFGVLSARALADLPG
jgi:tetratricopeptide (TPR) repeat protein